MSPTDQEQARPAAADVHRRDGRVSTGGATLRLDELDRGILACLREDGRITNADMARRLGVGQRTVTRRLERLKERAALRVVPVIEPESVDLNDCIYVGIRTSPSDVRRVAEAVRAMPEVRYLAITTGPWTLLAEAFVGSRRHMADFLIRSVGELDGVVGTETFSVLEIAKFGYEWEVPEYYHSSTPEDEVSMAHPAGDSVRRGEETRHD